MSFMLLPDIKYVCKYVEIEKKKQKISWKSNSNNNNKTITSVI